MGVWPGGGRGGVLLAVLGVEAPVSLGLPQGLEETGQHLEGGAATRVPRVITREGWARTRHLGVLSTAEKRRDRCSFRAREDTGRLGPHEPGSTGGSPGGFC